MSEVLSERVSVRVPDSLYFLLQRLSKEINLNISEMVRQAVVAWLKGLPQTEIPLQLRIPITKLIVQSKISTIRDLRYLYHARAKAAETLKGLRTTRRIGRFPEHVCNLLEQYENDLIEIITGFDKGLKAEMEGQP